MTAKAIALIVGFALAAPGAAVTPFLVKDINSTAANSPSNPNGFISFGNRAVFFAGEGFAGGELFGTDGTLAGTSRLTSASFLYFLAYGPKVAYLMEGYLGSYTVWVTDGTPGGTQRLSDEALSAQGAEQLKTAFLSAGSKRLYWTATQEDEGEELWTSNGTRAGTYRVADLAPGPNGSKINDLTPFRGRMFFTANDGQGFALWATNGTPAGTVKVASVPFDQPGRRPFKLRVVGQSLYFFLQETDSVWLWKSNGTAAGTVRVQKLPVVFSSSVFDVISHLGRLFFVAGTQLWTSDGTTAGTRILERATEYFPPQIPGKLIFVGGDSIHGLELWVSNGTPAGTRVLKDVCPGFCQGVSLYIRQFKVFRGRLVYPGITPGQGQELWSTDGTTAGTRILRDTCAGPCGGQDFRGAMIVAGNRLYFTAYDPSFAHQLWRSDGTPAGTFRVSNFPRDLFFPSFPGAAVGDALIFAGSDPIRGNELWRSDGSRPGTRLLADLEGPTPSSGIGAFTPVGRQVVFNAFDGVQSGSWVSDGTPEGTRPLPGAPRVVMAAPAVNLTYFYSQTEGPGAIWRTDGTEDGTFRLTAPELTIRSDLNLVAVGDLAYFVADDGVHGDEVWTSDGTLEGTRLLVDLVPGPSGSIPRDLNVILGRMTFKASPGGAYLTDGTEAGTRPFYEEFPFLDGLSPLYVESGGRSLFQKLAQGNASELWSSDGTEDGTRLVLDHLESFLNASAAGGHFVFQARTTGEAGDRIYLSDGSPAGTVQLASELVLDPRAIPLQAVAGRYVFSARPVDDILKRVLLTSDGTSAGTSQLLEAFDSPLLPLYASPFAGRLLLSGRYHMWITDGTSAGTSSIFPTPEFGISLPFVAGDRAYFSRRTLETGSELWALRPD